MSESEIWIDGAYADTAQPLIGIDDRGFLLGHAAFETMRCLEGRIRRWEAHRARLECGLAYLGIERPALLDDVPHAAQQLATRLGLTDAVARLTVTAGEGGGGLFLRADIPAHVVLTLKPRPAPPDAVSVRIVDGPRRSGSPGERFKLSGYADLIAARREAVAVGAERAIVTGPGGTLACTDCANLFWIAGGRVFTPSEESGALAGVTRSALIKAARADGLEVAEVRAGHEALMDAEAAFTTNAVEGVVAISAVNGLVRPADHPLITRLRALEQAFDQP